MLATKVNAIVAGQISVKAPENFEAHLSKDVHILSYHSLHGPIVSSGGQPLVLCTPLCMAQELIDLLRSSFNIEPAKMRSSRSRFVHLSFNEHDSVTANIQASPMLPPSGE